MKCLSVCQPYADLIVSGKKTVELRRWNTRYRGEFLVHTPLRILRDDCARLGYDANPVTGAIIGRAEIYDVKRYLTDQQIRDDARYHHAESYHGGAYGFMLRCPKRFNEPIPWKGRLGLFDIDLGGGRIRDDDIIDQIMEEGHTYGLVGRH